MLKKIILTPFLLILTVFMLSENSLAQTTPPPLPDAPDQVSATDESEGRRMFVKGITEFELENYEVAVELLVAARERLGDSPGLNLSIADAYFHLYDYTNAIVYAEKAVEGDPDEKWYRVKLAEIYQDAGRNSDAIEQFEKLVERYPYDLEIMYDLARALTLKGELVEANRVYDRILNTTGPDVQIYFQKYRNFNTLGQQDSSVVQLELMIEFDPTNTAAAKTLSQHYIEQGELDKAAELLEDAIATNRGDHELIVNLSDIYINQQRWEEAGDLLENLLRSDDTPQITKVELTQYFIGRLSRNPSNEALKQATGRLVEILLEEEPDFGYTHALAAEFFSFTGDDDRLLESLTETNRLLPENEPAWRQRLQIYLVRGEYDKLIETGLKADEAIPDDAFVLYFMGNAYMMQDNHEEAIEWYTRASSAPANREFRSVVYTVLGDAHSSMKSWEQADDSYEQALRLDPDNDVALNNFAYFLSTREMRLDEALKMAERAIEAEPGNAAYLDTIGWIHFKLDNLELAREYIHASVETGEASAVVLEHLGDVYEKIGDIEEAKKWWQKAYDKDESKEHLIEKLSGS